MGKIELVRTVNDSRKSTSLMIFKVVEGCNLSDVILKFSRGDLKREIPLPNIDVSVGDFIWISDYQDKELQALITEGRKKNTTDTSTYILVLKMPDLNLTDLTEY